MGLVRGSEGCDSAPAPQQHGRRRCRGAEGVDGGLVPPSRPGCTTVARRKHAQVEGLERHAQTRFQGNDDLRKGQLTL